MTNLDELINYTKDELLILWHKLPTRDKPPKAIKVLIRELAYRLLEQEYGKLDKNTTVSLRRHMTIFAQSLKNGKASKPVKPISKAQLEAGSEIHKDWQGQELVVKVLGQRVFEYEGQTYKSLSAVARAITGQHLSGPLFFNFKD